MSLLLSRLNTEARARRAFPGKLCAFVASSLPRLGWHGYLTGWLIMASVQVALGNDPQHHQMNLRCWISMGDNSTYTLKFRSAANGFEGLLFEHKNGYQQMLYVHLPSGLQHFTLSRDGAPPSERPLALEFFAEDDGAYTLLAFRPQGSSDAIMRKIVELPLHKEGEGIFIYNLLPGVPLYVTTADGKKSMAVPYSAEPLIFSPEALGGQDLVLSYVNKWNTRVESRVQWKDGQRISALFLRNSYAKPAVTILNAIPLE